jgi:hypothetical protein
MNASSATLVMIVAFVVGSAVAYFPDYAGVGPAKATVERLHLPALGETPATGSKLSVDAAYAAIPHRRTRFDARQATMSKNERDYLVLMLHVVDRAVVLRVEIVQALAGDKADAGTAEDFVAALDRLTAFTCSFEPPPRLRAYHRDVVDAFARQMRFFVRSFEDGGWRIEDRGKATRIASEVPAQSADAQDLPDSVRENEDLVMASRALSRAYDELMTAYRDEPRQNRDAFFDCHDALDILAAERRLPLTAASGP